MKKNGLRGYIILGILFVVLSVIAFAIPFSKTVVFWIAYLFAVIAIAYQLYVFKISFSNEGDVKSKFYGFPIAKIGLVYLIVQFVVSVIEMLLAELLPGWAALIANVVIGAAAVIGCIAADAVRTEIARQDMQLKKDVTNMRALQSLSASMVGLCNDADVKVLAQKIANEFKYSDPVSSEQTKDAEAELQCQMNEMQKAIIDGDSQAVKDLGNRILTGLTERNRICALSK